LRGRAGAAAADQRPHFRRSHRPLRSDINLIRQKHCLIRIVRYEDHSALKFVLYAYKPFVHRRASERVKCTERFIKKDYRAFAEWSATAPPFGACRRRACRKGVFETFQSEPAQKIACRIYRLRERPAGSGRGVTFSRTVRYGNSKSRCIMYATLPSRPSMSTPSSATPPESRPSKPAILNNVDLPHSPGPINETKSFGRA
jgi:hypothetical protein